MNKEMVNYKNFENETTSQSSKDITQQNDEESSVHFTSEGVTIGTNPLSGSLNVVTPEKPSHSKLRRFIEHIAFRIVCASLVIADITILIIDISENPQEDFMVYEYTSLGLVTCFLLEVLLRIYALGFKQFFFNWINIIDLFVIIVSFIINLVSVLLPTKVPSFTKFLIIGRLVRLLVLLRLYTQHVTLKKGARQYVSQNKRRYQQDGFDLDLTYVTNRVIAMSFPSSGKMSFYRNSIREVSKFFEYKHKGHYKIYNLCSEKGYDETFFKNRVERFFIDDHNVPSLLDMVNFVKSVEDWLAADPQNVIAVHCKGGKGRTGTMICIWLIHSGLFGSAEASLSYFGDRRTDLSVGSKFQGVETPSQSRYVEYFTAIKEIYNGIPPKEVPIHLTKVIIHGSSCLGRFKGEDLICKIFQGKTLVLECDFALRKNCDIIYNQATDALEISLINCPIVSGDVKFLFNSTSKYLPRGYENCHFYFWFHTSFLDNFQIYIERKDLDNPHKPKTWKVYSENFAVEVIAKPA